MSFGLTAAQVGMIGVGAGALMGGQSGSNSATQSTQNQIDPRMVPFLYGDSGLLNGVNNLFQKQNAQGGLNPMQTAGLEMQRQTLMNPAFTRGFDQMRSLGGGLMGQGVAGNPFTGAPMATAPQMPQMPQMGRIGLQPEPSRMNALGFGAPNDATSAAYQPIQQATAAPNVAPPVVAPLVDEMLNKYGGQPWGAGRYDDPSVRNVG
jgi:hypothetical protein